ncbi:hypothetical protein KC930_02860 [Candidatus Saccharibacteria bacterium]|nr:hypothetical protein [Candidatus Saccharibacteria bacterium]
MTSVSNYWTTKGYEPGDVKVGFEAKDVTSVLGFLRRVPNTHHVHGGRGQVFFTVTEKAARAGDVDELIGSILADVSRQFGFDFIKISAPESRATSPDGPTALFKALGSYGSAPYIPYGTSPRFVNA